MGKAKRRSMTWRTFRENCTFRNWNTKQNDRPECRWYGTLCRPDCPRWRRLPVVKEKT